MSRDAERRFEDILAAIDRSLQYREHLTNANPKIASMAFDAVLRNLAVIGEAVRALPAEATTIAPSTPWSSIAGLRNIVIHEYCRIDPQVILDIVDNQLLPLRDAILLRGE